MVKKLTIATKTERYDYIVGKMVALFLLLNACNITIKTLFISDFITNYLSIILGGVYGCYLLFQLKKMKVILPKLLLFETVFIVLLAVSMLINLNVAISIFSRCIWTIIFCIPMYLMVLHMKDTEKLLVSMEKVSWIVLGMGILMFLYHMYSENQHDYSMAFAYMILFAVLLHINIAFKKKLMWLPVIAEITLILIYGSRGSLLCIAVFLIYKVICYGRIDRRVVRIVLAMVVVLFVILFWNQIAEIFSNAYHVSGIYSRTLNMFLNSRISYSSGRFDIYALVWEKVMEKPLLGWGIAGELAFMKSYPHLLFLELMVHFGILIGGLLSFFIIASFLKSAIENRITDCWMLFFCCGFVPLLLSSTYLQEPRFWILIALCFKKGGYKIGNT